MPDAPSYIGSMRFRDPGKLDIPTGHVTAREVAMWARSSPTPTRCNVRSWKKQKPPLTDQTRAASQPSRCYLPLAGLLLPPPAPTVRQLRV
jgi:hypothetical protein